MELLCPTCQQQLTLPDTSAGQPVKCPQCGGVFTTPTLSGVPEPFVAPPPAPAPAVAPIVQPPPVLPAPVTAVDQVSSPSPISRVADVSPPPFTPAPAYTPQAAAHPSPAPVMEDYRHKWTIWINPAVLQGLAVVAAVVLFVLSFFPWVGIYPGGVPISTQSAWQAGFGGHSFDTELGKELYGLLLVPLLLLTVAAGVLTVLAGPLPAWLVRLKPWRWGIVAGVALLMFILLTLQLVTGFKVESKVQTDVETKLADRPKAATSPVDVKRVSHDRGVELGVLYRTTALTGVFWLQLLLVVCAALVFRFERRPSRPMPRIDLAW